MVTGRPSNKPYEPIYYPDMAQPWRGLMVLFLRFCERLTIESKDVGVVPLILNGPQRYAVEEIFWGFSCGLHDFVILKARQLGLSTLLWAFDLFWLTKFSLQGMYIADDEPNKEIHRDIIGKMYVSLPNRWKRGPFRAHNRLETTWNDAPTWPASRLMWAFANKRQEGQLGRSRGANYIHAEELDSWTDEHAMSALEATRSAVHPRRAYFWVGTGQGYSTLYQMWEQAEGARTSKQIFIAFWRNEHYRITREQRALWAAYGQPSVEPNEREWAEEVYRRYKVKVTKEYLAWWRFTLREGKGILGDEAKMMQEYPWLPEQAFQAAGSQFLQGVTCMKLRMAARLAPTPKTYRYEWGATFDEKGDEVLVEVPEEAATLHIWEEPDPARFYIVSGDPAYASSPDSDRYAITVWRSHPDQIIQVAQYQTPIGTMYQFAWILAHLSGIYPPYLIHELNGPGYAVLQELDRMGNYGFGLSVRGGKLQNVISAIQHHLWRRADALQASYSREWKMTPQNREEVFEQLRDTTERGALMVRSAELATELAALRRDGTDIRPGGVAHDDLAVTAALASRQWLENVIPEIENMIAPATADPRGPRDVVETLVVNHFRRMAAGDAEEEERKKYGVTRQGPGR